MERRIGGHPLQRPLGSFTPVRRPDPPAASQPSGRLIFAVVTLFVATLSTTASHAQSGPFAGMAGVWSGGGTVTLDDGSTERIRCRETAAVGDRRDRPQSQPDLRQRQLQIRSQRQRRLRAAASLSGTWSESTRGVTGNLEGRGGNGNFEVVANAAGFTASLSVTTRGNRQSVVDQGPERLPGRLDCADPPLAGHFAQRPFQKPCAEKRPSRPASASPAARRFP